MQHRYLYLSSLVIVLVAAQTMGCRGEVPLAVTELGVNRASGSVVDNDYDRAISLLRTLPDPIEILSAGKQNAPEAQKMLSSLHDLSLLPDQTLEQIYAFEEHKTKTTAFGRQQLTNLLSLLTRMAYRVEDIGGHRKFPNEIDGGLEINNWLYPLRLQKGKFMLAGREVPLYMCIWPSASEEWAYVKKHARRR
ncbi:hypothetical protein BH11ARM1_BH11ARM1_09920 [soil metagenome]